MFLSKVRSTTLDKLLPEHIEQLKQWGNAKANEVCHFSHSISTK